MYKYESFFYTKNILKNAVLYEDTTFPFPCGWEEAKKHKITVKKEMIMEWKPVP